jgi:hypothetical protein
MKKLSGQWNFGGATVRHDGILRVYLAAHREAPGLRETVRLLLEGADRPVLAPHTAAATSPNALPKNTGAHCCEVT